MCDIDLCNPNQKDHSPLPQVTNLQRRAFTLGLASLPLATVLAYPDLAKAAGAKMQDFKITAPDGEPVLGSLAIPEAGKDAPAILLIHEWYGLNDQIRAVAHELSRLGYLALAIDMYDGQYGASPREARELMMALDQEKATNKVKAAIEWLRKNGRGKVATMGWCFGGGWSLNTSLATPVDATVIYYGRVNKTAAELKTLQSPVLGHFGTEDKFIDKVMVDGFEAEMKKAGKTDYTVHWYEADHAFANPTISRYDAADAALAWQRNLDFFKKHLD